MSFEAVAGLGLLVARAVLGLLMVGHGSQKLFGWFGGYGLTGTGGFMEKLGFYPGWLFAAAAGTTEVVGGLLLALGFMGPVGPALVISVMIVAAISAHWKNGIFAQANGIEVPLLYATGAFALALTGPGRLSLDAVLGLNTLWSPSAIAVVLALGMAGGAVNLALRKPAQSSAA